MSEKSWISGGPTRPRRPWKPWKPWNYDLEWWTRVGRAGTIEAEQVLLATGGSTPGSRQVSNSSTISIASRHANAGVRPICVSRRGVDGWIPSGASVAMQGVGLTSSSMRRSSSPKAWGRFERSADGFASISPARGAAIDHPVQPQPVCRCAEGARPGAFTKPLTFFTHRAWPSEKPGPADSSTGERYLALFELELELH